MTKLYSDHVDLYDVAFDWDIADEVEWLLERFGPSCRSVLEPGCGTGRMLEAFGRRGFEAAGIDSSEQMVQYARRRLSEAGVEGTVVFADMTDFDLGRTFDGAVCPINTLLHLTPPELSEHFECMGRHLLTGGRYLVQVGLRDPDSLEEVKVSEWEASRGELRLRVSWSSEDVDAARGRERSVSRIEILSGERAGELFEEIHETTFWTPESWERALGASPLQRTATYDGVLKERPRVDPQACGGLLWHELVRV